MKLNRDNFKKTTTPDDRVMYQYTCNEQNFYLVYGYVNGKRMIKVWSGEENMLLDDDLGFTFDNTLDAWAKFEELLEVCAPKQSSSGGFKNNPQENPNILPLLAIGDIKDNNKRDVTFFVQLDDNSQTSVYTFEVESNLLPSTLPKDKAFVVDWTSIEAPMLFKSEILMKNFDKVKFEEQPDKLVFLFIPKNIVNQGGEEGGNTDGGDGDGEGQPMPSNKKGDEKDKKGDDEGGQKGDDKGDEKGDEKGGEGDEKGGEEKDEEEGDEKPSNKAGEGEGDSQQKDEYAKPSDEGQKQDLKVDFGDSIMRISDITGEPPSVVSRFFSKKNSGALFLQTNKFTEIKRALGLPQELNQIQVSEIIINSK